MKQDTAKKLQQNRGKFWHLISFLAYRRGGSCHCLFICLAVKYVHHIIFPHTTNIFVPKPYAHIASSVTLNVENFNLKLICFFVHLHLLAMVCMIINRKEK